MAVQAGCGFKQPTPVFAVPLPVPREPPRRLGVTSSSPPRDPGSDVIMAGRRSGQWVTLSKTLLLQLVERICQLSFQTDVVTSASVSSPLYRKSADELGPEVEIESFRRRSSSADHGGIRSEKDNGQDATKYGAVAEKCRTPLCQDDFLPALPDSDKTTSGPVEMPDDERPSAASCSDEDQNSTVELDMVVKSSNDEKEPMAGAEFSGTVIEADRVPSEASTSGENQLNDRHRHRHRRQRSVCRRRTLRTRRRKRAPLATSGGQVRRRVAARRGDEASTGAGRRTHLRGVRRCSRQSWMALSKDIVYDAVENELLQVDAPGGRSPVASSSPTKAAAIWNPATCLSPSEKRRSRTDLDCAPAPTDFRRRDVAFRQPGSDVISRSRDPTLTGSSSVLSELLGFGTATPTVVLPVPAEVVLTRQRHCSYSGGETTTTTFSAISPPFISGSGVEAAPRGNPAHARSLSGSPSRDDVITALNYCIRRDTINQQEELVVSSVPRIWRPVESSTVQSSPRFVVSRPRWVAVNKGDVCSLVDNLVSTMIASEDCAGATSTDGGSGTGAVRDASTLLATSQLSSSSSCRPVLQLPTRCSVATSEPRKWKSDLLQRVRNEHAT